MFTDLYLQTTNPKLSLEEMFSTKIFINILFSVIFHTMVYVLFANIVNYIFFGKSLSNIINIRLISFLLLIMFFGFFARYFHVKEICKSYHYDLEKTRNHLDRLYIGWIFIS
jgi:hypothetical protein